MAPQTTPETVKATDFHTPDNSQGNGYCAICGASIPRLRALHKIENDTITKITMTVTGMYKQTYWIDGQWKECPF
jgi:hypothetical protein